jgi:hypothetical protein
MVDGLNSYTSVSLLGRLNNRSTDAAAWKEFVHRYGRASITGAGAGGSKMPTRRM